MNTRIVMLPEENANTRVISLDAIAKFMPSALVACGRYLRRPDGTRAATPGTDTLNRLFVEYLKYLNFFQFRYTLSSGVVFWDAETIGSPEGNCQTVASNFLYLLWAYGFEIRDLGIHIVEVEHPKNEKIVCKKPGDVNPANVNSDDAPHLGGSRGTRSFKVNRLSGAIEPLGYPRNPFVFHAISYIASGGVYKYYDARSGLKYVNGATDFFEGFRKGTDFEYVKGGAAPGFVSLVSLKQKSTQAFFDPRHPSRRMYLLPSEYDSHRPIAQAVGAYSEGGNWIFVEDEDWTGARAIPTGTRPPAHVKRVFEA